MSQFMKKWTDNIYFMLVEPKEPGNIGATARAIKNMGFKNLWLINPPPKMNNEAKLFAHNAIDVLESARVFPSLKEAVSDMQYVVGTSRRRGRRRGAFVPVESGTRRLFETALNNKVAILFGREDRGLFNDEIDRCGFLMTIPASKRQPSLNLAQAAIIIAYELSKTDEAASTKKDSMSAERLLHANPAILATQEELAHLYKRLEKSLKMIGYIDSDEKYFCRKVMKNLKHCLGRAGLTGWEYNMFQGICSSIEKKIGNK